MDILNTLWQTTSRLLVDLSPHIDLFLSHFSWCFFTFPSCLSVRNRESLPFLLKNTLIVLSSKECIT